MCRKGQVIERIERPAAADRRGPIPAVFSLPNGKTVRLRTNNKPAVMTKAESGAADASLPFESEDYLGVVFPAERPNVVVGYLVPSPVAAAAYRDIHARWLAADPGHSRDNETRVIRFDRIPGALNDGYANKWAEYCLGEIELDAPAAPSRTAGGDIVECVKRMRAVAAEYGYDGVRISIEIAPDLVGHF
jgi:hypothetical protein